MYFGALIQDPDSSVLVDKCKNVRLHSNIFNKKCSKSLSNYKQACIKFPIQNVEILFCDVFRIKKTTFCGKNLLVENYFCAKFLLAKNTFLLSG